MIPGPRFSPTTLHQIPTPALLLERSVLERNLDTMAHRCRELGVALRPHIKTHKCLQICRRQVDRGARGLTVSTLEETRLLASAGCDDLTWAFPVILSRLGEVLELSEHCILRLVVDSRQAVDALEALEYPFSVLLKVDCGYHRAGVEPRDPLALELARTLADSPLLTFTGILSHSGHAYDVQGKDALAAVAESERRVMVDFAERLRGEGIAVDTVSVGSTPAMSAVEDLTGVTEARPGNYAYFDYSQVVLGSCGVADCALTVLASVVSRKVVDAGALALSKDPGPAAELLPAGEPVSAGRLLTEIVLDEPAALDSERWLTGLSQEHGKLSTPLPVGTRVRILPHHSCLTAACFDSLWLVDGEEVLDRWRVHRGRLT